MLCPIFNMIFKGEKNPHNFRPVKHSVVGPEFVE